MGVLVFDEAPMIGSTFAEDPMRRAALCLIVVALATPLCAKLAHAQNPQASAVPHAWLFGSWTGGLFPVPSNLTAQACLSQPVVIFTRDMVLHATLTDTIYHQRIIETVRSGPNRSDFRFAPGIDPAAAMQAGLLGVKTPMEQSGFGCDSPDSLHVVRRGENEIVFEGCKSFPEPLIRCPAK
jgi:hypothetical protein